MILIQLSVFTFRPLIRFWVQRMSHRIVRIVLKTHSSCRIPFSMFFAEALLSVGSQLQLLSLSQLDNQNFIGCLSVLVVLVLSMSGGHRQHSHIARLEISRRHMASLLVVAFDIQGKFHRALNTEIHTGAITTEVDPFDDFIGNQWNQADTMG